MTADELIEQAQQYPGLWCEVATYAKGSSPSRGRRRAQRRWPNVEFSNGARSTLWARWPGPADATPPADAKMTVATRVPQPGTEATLAADERIEAARHTPGTPVKVATYSTSGGAWKAANTQLPKRYENQPVTFKATTAGRENAVWATWETT